ncbi:aldo/keto reductase [Salinisphaera sp. PC39]|uniref:NADP(H)-dependent aldo-keto reductase n=1 Tax=Salinisphaera sp. PC39 TaxID=1304156 RepID=UPI003342B04F
MKYRPLGSSGLNVSVIGLGTMTFGQQNTEADAHEQIDYALSQGVNFIDTAEMYPVPPRAETQGRTEEYIGSWLARHGRREDIILATKATGRSEMTWIRDGQETRPGRGQLRTALEASLRRLRTDYVDLYQIHWPDRRTNFFGRLGYTHKPAEDEIALEETLEEAAELVASGKVRFLGISNETPWGLMRYLHLAETRNLPRIVSIQNPYSLLNRSFEVGLAECAHRERVPLLAYSPLAFGVLSGKYLDGAAPKDARLTLFDRFTRYNTQAGERAARAYVELARDNGLDPAQMALAYVNSRSFLASNLVGATTMDQLRSDIASIDIDLDDEILAEIEGIHESHPNPCP